MFSYTTMRVGNTVMGIGGNRIEKVIPAHLQYRANLLCKIMYLRLSEIAVPW